MRSVRRDARSRAHLRALTAGDRAGAPLGPLLSARLTCVGEGRHRLKAATWSHGNPLPLWAGWREGEGLEAF